MAITDELREYARSWRETPNLMDDLDAGDIDGLLGDIEHIADRIDEAHKHAIGYVDDRDPETMAENGWIKLPVDTDGVPIRIGDVMEGEKIGGGFGEPFEVVGYIMSNGELEPMDEHKCPRKYEYLRHHKQPTVEDVMVEFATDWDSAQDGEDKTAVLKKYAAKLRLAGDAE